MSAHVGVFTVLSRQWCHLCHELVEALEPIARHYGWRIEVVDIEREPALEARWDELIPVVLVDGVEICHHRLDAEAVHACCRAFPIESIGFAK
ncbi:MAG: glutaredoxin family protein [Betaproteobacteria bacterium]|nr:glutaredoxin family protein [Betaproteobacteria bacterium]